MSLHRFILDHSQEPSLYSIHLWHGLSSQPNHQPTVRCNPATSGKRPFYNLAYTSANALNTLLLLQTVKWNGGTPEQVFDLSHPSKAGNYPRHRRNEITVVVPLPHSVIKTSMEARFLSPNSINIPTEQVHSMKYIIVKRISVTFRHPRK